MIIKFAEQNSDKVKLHAKLNPIVNIAQVSVHYWNQARNYFTLKTSTTLFLSIRSQTSSTMKYENSVLNLLVISYI